MMPRQRNHRARHRKPGTIRQAFTLVEVTIALGLVAGGVVVLLALLPASLGTMGEASRTAVERRIAQNLIGELMRTKWEELSYQDGSPPRYFDSQGIELPLEIWSTRPGLVSFTARISVPRQDVRIDQDDTLLSVSQTIPYSKGDLITPFTNPHLRRVTVDITDVPIQGFDFDDALNRNRFRSYSSVVCNLTKDDGG